MRGLYHRPTDDGLRDGFWSSAAGGDGEAGGKQRVRKLPRSSRT